MNRILESELTWKNNFLLKKHLCLYFGCIREVDDFRYCCWEHEIKLDMQSLNYFQWEDEIKEIDKVVDAIKQRSRVFYESENPVYEDNE